MRIFDAFYHLHLYSAVYLYISDPYSSVRKASWASPHTIPSKGNRLVLVTNNHTVEIALSFCDSHNTTLMIL